MFSGIVEIYDTLVVQIHLYFDIIKCFLSKKALIQDIRNRKGRRAARIATALPFGYHNLTFKHLNFRMTTLASVDLHRKYARFLGHPLAIYYKEESISTKGG